MSIAEPPRVVEPSETEPSRPVPPINPNKIVIAVHGIGNQFQFETVRSVAHGFCRFFGAPAAIPLGRFHPLADPAPQAFFPTFPPDPAFPCHQRIGFAEIYWADIPREVVRSGFILEGAQAWARTLVERIRLRNTMAQKAADLGRCEPPMTLSEADFVLLEDVLEEMIESVDVIDRICALARKANLFQFNLKELLADFLGDVQIVTEFQEYRCRMLDQFSKVMRNLEQSDPNAELYLVAHSEGTVVTLLGLLEGLTAEPMPGWVKQVRGLMTIGSPLNKHLILWPELWTRFALPPQIAGPPKWLRADFLGDDKHRIRWQNYYDYGDPIAFQLDRTRELLRIYGLDYVFDFPESNDFGFARYPFPGKAHVDYWNDEGVFGHFILDVVEPACEPQPEFKERVESFRKPPESRFGPRIVSYILPYPIAFTLLFLGVYLMYRSVVVCVDAAYYEKLPPWTIARNVFGISGLLAGLTLLARVPRLARAGLVLGLSMLAAFILMVVYAVSVDGYIRQALAAPILRTLGQRKAAEAIEPTHGLGVLLQGNHGVLEQTLATLGLAVVLGVVVFAVSRVAPHIYSKSRWAWTAVFLRGVRPLLLLGGAAAAMLIAVYVMEEHNGQDVWPVFLSGAAFFYLWWLATLLFDLIFVWHRYIRRSTGMDRLGQLIPAGSYIHGEPTSGPSETA